MNLKRILWSLLHYGLSWNLSQWQGFVAKPSSKKWTAGIAFAALFMVCNPLNSLTDDTFFCKRDYRMCMLTSLMDSVYRQGNYNGMILVAENGNVVFRKAYGRISYDSGRILTPESEMQLASVSKPITAVAIMMLAERGQLNYDDNLNLYFPKLKYSGVTIRHLLNHTSGIPDYINDTHRFNRQIYRQKNLLSNQDLLDYLVRQRPRVHFAAGADHHYSNTGYALLALIVEQTSGMSFRDFLQKNIFDPLGMSQTYLYSADKHTKMLRDQEPLDGVLGDKGVFSTVDDLLKFDQALHSERLVSAQTLETAYKEGVTNRLERFGYGYGWRILRPDFEEPVIYHKGLWQGANPMFIRFVNCNRVIISLHEPQRGMHGWELVWGINKVLNQSENFCFQSF
jgi:CubicO group peptidase (beta-lactamase class C family)